MAGEFGERAVVLARIEDRNGSALTLTNDRGGQRDLYITDATGSNVVQLTNDDFFEYAPDW